MAEDLTAPEATIEKLDLPRIVTEPRTLKHKAFHSRISYAAIWIMHKETGSL
jgi:hypothetical protein